MNGMDPRIDDPSLIETRAEPSGLASISSTSSADEGRFVAGTLLGGRYRIIGLLGRGGMGEVYRATDLTLGQSVALKFLPLEAAGNTRLLERFAGEVRVARQVSHPNVCRVYDLGEVDGAPFISMEYVDGEDLSSLLTRIGRLPVDKALEVARKICAGLAAAHDRGIVHRDLKPQNIMMNKRGEVVIMDFGLAGLADQLSGAEARNGTPAYMAPEQLKGAEVTVRSDIYALGLVLFELFTGKRPYDAKSVPQLLSMQESGQLPSMTSLATDVDPAVEKAIRRCLEADPAKRPGTALAVAAALPGGDPLAAALAAGETPSPELVAAAGKTEGMDLRYSLPCLLVVILSICAAPVIRQQQDALMHGSLEMPPDVLAQKGREIAATLGYARKPADTNIALEHRPALDTFLGEKPGPRKWDEWLASEAPIMAVYRESQSPLLAEPFGYVSPTNPPPIDPGMVFERIDGHGMLREFSAIPYDDQSAGAPVDFDAVFRVAGLDARTFTQTTPTLVPQHASDEVRAWKGPHPKIPDTELTIQAAVWKGRVTQILVEFPWNGSSNAADANRDFLLKIRGLFMIASIGCAGFFGLLYSRRNWKKGRVDKKGALRLAIAAFAIGMIHWAGQVHPIPTDDMLSMIYEVAGDSALFAAMLWVLYLALEPAVRSSWPHAIVTWNRILAGRWKDAQVGAHILIGAAVGMGLWTITMLVGGQKDKLEPDISLWPLLGNRELIAAYALNVREAMVVGMAAFFAIFGLRRLLKRDWLAAVAASLLFTVSQSQIFSDPQWQKQTIIYVVLYTILMFVLIRVGLLTTVSAIFFLNALNRVCLGSDWKAWWAPSGFTGIIFLLILAFYAFWRSIGARELAE